MRGGVIPPSRHVLYGDDDDLDETTSYERQLKVPGNLPSGETVILVAYRLTALARLLVAQYKASDCEPLVLSTKTISGQNEDVINDLYDCDVIEYEKERQSTRQFQAKHSPGTLIIHCPELDNAEAAFAAKSLVTELKPGKLILVTPGQMFGDSPVACIATKAWSEKLEVAPASPPTMIQGLCASVISSAERLNVPAVALIVNSDGPVNWESMDPQSVVLTMEKLLAICGLGHSESSNRSNYVDLSTLYV